MSPASIPAGFRTEIHVSEGGDNEGIFSIPSLNYCKGKGSEKEGGQERGMEGSTAKGERI
jgi:hypothetical protein